MTASKSKTVSQKPASQTPYRVRLPGFILPEARAELGLGDLIKHATSAVGIKSCGSCARRAAMLNSRIVFTGRRPR